MMDKKQMSHFDKKQYEYLVRSREEIGSSLEFGLDLLGEQRWKLLLIDKDIIGSRDDKFIFIRTKIST